jgi:hypothetical protein
MSILIHRIFHSIFSVTVCSFILSCSNVKPDFTEKIIDDHAPENLWMKTTGDINNDGITDILAGGWLRGGMAAYLAPDWTKVMINDTLKISTDAEVSDVNNNNIPDIIAVVDKAIVWFEGPDWGLHLIDSITGHDVEVADFDNDGLIDIISRNQGAFGTDGGHTLYFFNQNPQGEWTRYQKGIPDGEGIKMADINLDDKIDIVTNGCWFENTGSMSEWAEHKFTDTWEWVNAAIEVADINSDGRPDILHSPSELRGNYYRISWFEAPENPASIWKEHIVIDSVETVLHSIGAADFNLDGMIDIITAEMQQGEDPDEVAIFYNNGSDEWVKQVISTQGSHSMRIYDFDGDGDIDVAGANFAEHVLKMWVNELKRNNILPYE